MRQRTGEKESERKRNGTQERMGVKERTGEIPGGERERDRQRQIDG